MYSQPRAWHQLCGAFATVMVDYLKAQVEAGVQALQIFDSWAGALGRLDYREFAMPHTRPNLRGAARRRASRSSISASAPPQSCRDLARDRRRRRRRRLASAARRCVDDRRIDRGIQGNLDPTLLLGPPDRLLAAADDVLRRAAGRPGHIFNLGHGILPETPVEHVQALARHVHAFALPALDSVELAPLSGASCT